jgi:hypothetical protein
MEYREFLAAGDKQFRAHLEEHQRVIGGLLEELKAQGEQISQEAAQVVKTSGREAVRHAQVSLEQVGQAAQRVGELARRAAEATQKTAEQSEALLGRLDQASQRMETSEQNVEVALDALLPKVAGIRKDLEKELGEAVVATAATEDAIKKMVVGIRSSMTKEMESEIRTKLRSAADHAAERIHNLGEWWEHFTRFGIHALMAISMLATGMLGWWFGRHQIEEGIHDRVFRELKANTRVVVFTHKFFLGLGGEVKHEPQIIEAPLVWLGNGRLALMTRNSQGQWVYDKIVMPSQSLALGQAYDVSQNNKAIREERP